MDCAVAINSRLIAVAFSQSISSTNRMYPKLCIDTFCLLHYAFCFANFEFDNEIIECVIISPHG